MTEESREKGALAGALSLWPYALVLAVGLFVLVPNLGDFGFWDPWEPKYAETAREMIERDSYIVPYYRQEVRLTKPILVYWGILAGSAVFGLNEFGARIVGVCLALATLAGVTYAISLLRGRTAGVVSALVVGTLPHFYFISRQAMPDVYLFTSIGMGLLFLCLGLFGPDRRRNVHFGLSYACVALAVLAKGPFIAGTVFLTTLAIWAVIQIDLRELWQRGRRGETLLFGLTAFPAMIVAGFLSPLVYVFGTSPLWWGYSDSSREDVAERRDQIEAVFARLHLSEVLLVLVALLAVGTTWSIVKRGRDRGQPFLGRAALAGLAAIAALAGLVTGDASSRIFVATALATAACLFALVSSTWRFVRQEWLWPILRPFAGQLGRQLLLFLIVFVAVAGPWHLGIFVKQSHGYMTDFIIKHNITRAGETVNRTGASDFYLRVLIFGFFPWSCFLPAAIASLVGWWDRSSLKRHGLEAFLLVASVVTFAAFTISATKFTHYLSPLIVPVGVLIGLTVSRTLRDGHAPAARLVWIASAMLFLLPTVDLLGEGGSAQLIESFTMKRWVPAALAPGAYWQGLLVFAGACLILSILVRSRILVGGLILAATLFAHHNTSVFIPELSRHKTMKHLCETWKDRAPDGTPPIGFFGDMKHGIFFYTEYRVRVLTTRTEFQEFSNPEREVFCIIERDSFSTLQTNHRRAYSGGKLHVVDDSHFKYMLISNFPQPRATGP
jgi:4-amino-4-deoxy-L-arabinose transferase-like glycosyltransferase